MKAEGATWPPERFYWGVLDTSTLGPSPYGARGEQLGFLFERVLPVPIESLQAAYCPAGKHCVVACGINREALVPATNAIALTPESLPSFIDAQVDPRRLNLLTGSAEPTVVRRARRQWQLEVAAGLLVVALILFAGLRQEAALRRASSTEAATALQTIYDAVLQDAGPSAQPASLRLTTELRSLRQTRGEVVRPEKTPSAAAALAKLLAHWPRGLDVNVELVSVTESSITVRAVLDDTERAQSFAASFAGLPGWSMSQPEVRGIDDGVTVTVRLERSQEPST